jgi:putative transposase
LWRAVDQDGEVVDVFPQKRRGRQAIYQARYKGEPRKIVTDKLRSYCVTHRELSPEATHDTSQYANKRAELSREPIRVRERGMRKSKSMNQAQRLLQSVTYSTWDVT